MNEGTTEIMPESTLEPEKKERLVLSLDDLKDIVAKELGNKAKIESLDISEISDGVKLSAELDAGFTGGKISIGGAIVNSGDGLEIKNLDIEARGYVKSMIEGNLSKFSGAIKKYFTNKYGKPVSSIKIDGSNLIVELENISGGSMSKKDTPKTPFENTLGLIDKMQDSWGRSGSIETFLKKLIDEKRFDDARRVAGLIKDENSRAKTMGNIDRIEKSS